MKKIITVATLCLLQLNLAKAQSWNQVSKLVSSDFENTTDRSPNDYFGYSVATSDNYAIVTSFYEDDDENNFSTTRMENAGAAYIFKQTNGVWTRLQKIVAKDRIKNGVFGISAALSGDYAVIGASNAVYVFYKQANGNWIQQEKIVAKDLGTSDAFGRSVSISGDYILVGAPYESEDATGGNTKDRAGSAYIFKRGANWEQQQKIVASDRDLNYLFGYSVSISGNNAIVGSINSAGQGAAYIFKQLNNKWTQQQKIVASDKAYDDYFGSSCVISADYAFVGAVAEDEDSLGKNTKNQAGSVYIFKQTNGVWQQQQKVVPNDRLAGDQFGFSMSNYGDHLVVTANYGDKDASGKLTRADAGSAYIFENINGSWQLKQKLSASDWNSYDRFGQSVSISSKYILIGADLDDVSGTNPNLVNSGSAYIFEISGPNGVVEEANSKSTLRIYPNPTQNEVSLTSQSPISGVFSLFNLQGKQVLEQNISGTQAKISLVNLPQGVYQYELKDTNGKSEKGKLVVQ